MDTGYYFHMQIKLSKHYMRKKNTNIGEIVWIDKTFTFFKAKTFVCLDTPTVVKVNNFAIANEQFLELVGIGYRLCTTDRLGSLGRAILKQGVVV